MLQVRFRHNGMTVMNHAKKTRPNINDRVSSHVCRVASLDICWGGKYPTEDCAMRKTCERARLRLQRTHTSHRL